MADQNEPDKVWDIPLKDIRVSKNNVRHEGVTRDLDELAASIQKHGQLQPVLLLGTKDRPPYDLIVGQRRYEACRLLRKPDIRAIFEKEHLDEVGMKIRSLAENMHRKELEYEDAANVVTFLYKKLGRDVKRVHRETGMSIYRVRQYIYVEELASAETKKALRERKVRALDVQRALLAVGGDAKKADEFLEVVKTRKLAPSQVATAVEYGRSNPKAPVEAIVKEALRPRVERTLWLNLADHVREGLEKAVSRMNLTAPEIAATAIEEWLSAKGFMDG